MKLIAGFISFILLISILIGCASTGHKSPEALAREYAARARQFEKQGDLVEALEHYKLVMTVDPDNEPARQKIAMLEPRMLELANKHYKDGMTFYNKGQYGQARKEFLTALRYNPEHVKAKNRLAGTSQDMGQVKRYIVHTLQPDESISTLAEHYYGDYRKFHLIADYNELEDPTLVKVGQEIKIPVIEGIPVMADPGNIQAEEGVASEALTGEIITVKRYIIHTVQPEESLSRLSMMYYGDYSKFHVIAKFNNLEDGTSVRVVQELKIPEIEGVPFKTTGEVAQTHTGEAAKIEPMAETIAEKKAPMDVSAKQATPDDPMAHYRKHGIKLYEGQEYEAAIAEFDKVLNANPADQTARSYMSLAYQEKGRQSFENKAYGDAQKEFETALIYDRSCPDCRTYIARIQKENSQNLRDDGIALFNEKKFKQAIVKFEAVAKNDPNDKQVREYLEKSHFRQGLILFGKEDFLAARDEFKASLQYNADCDQCKKNIQKSEDFYKEVHYNKGLSYFGDQKLAEAIREWESVSAIDPNYKDVDKNLTKAKTLYERLESIKHSKTQEGAQ
jgi:tetratricopeptide (TPR) repeat protein